MNAACPRPVPRPGIERHSENVQLHCLMPQQRVPLMLQVQHGVRATLKIRGRARQALRPRCRPFRGN
jgi:hypothetical protein